MSVARRAVDKARGTNRQDKHGMKWFQFKDFDRVVGLIMELTLEEKASEKAIRAN
jgi:hypothetical protein